MTVQIIDSDLRRRVVRALAVQDDLCHEWTGTLRHGYGTFVLRGRRYMAHRAAYEVAVGPIPAGLEIDHLCRNRRCCNPEHLEAVTGAENRRRQGAAVAQCPAGHEYTEQNTMTGSGGRTCRACKSERAKAAYRRKRPISRKDRPRGKCLRGHEPTAENTYTAPNGSVQCRPCNRERNVMYRARRAAAA